MLLPDANSPLWLIVRLAVIGGITALLLEINYRHGFTPSVDVPTLLGVIAAVAGMDLLKHLATRSGDKP